MPTSWQLRSERGQLTAFNRADGTRISYGPTPVRLRAPELLDVKLTDVCSVGCAFCYQDSRPDRQHAKLEDVAFIAAEAGKAGVFEVALGGGEVSEYPHFLEALRLFRAAGVVPNFTTKRMRWLARLWPELRDLVGGVAVSVGSAAEIRLLDQLIPAAERRPGQLVVQVVMGTVERDELLRLVQAAGAAEIRVTLLGFKDVGRGQSFRPLPYDWWLADLPEYVQATPVSIDTALAAKCPADLEKFLLPGSYHTEEGRFSAYIDAVSMTLAPSSYHAGPAYPFDTDWLAQFAVPGFVQGPPTPPAWGRVRLGFATNSSSSHSLVLLKTPMEDDPADPAEWEEGFVSNWFTASSVAAKMYYLAANLMRQRGELYPGLTEAEAAAEIHRLCGLPPELAVSREGVDKESLLDLPVSPDATGPHPQLFERVKATLKNPHTAVWGRSDDWPIEDDPRWPAAALELDSAQLERLLKLPESRLPWLPLSPMPEVSPSLAAAVEAIDLVRGRKFAELVQAALRAGVPWDTVREAFFNRTDKERPTAKPPKGFLAAAVKALLDRLSPPSVGAAPPAVPPGALLREVLQAAGLEFPAGMQVKGRWQDSVQLEDDYWNWLQLYTASPEPQFGEFWAAWCHVHGVYPDEASFVLDYAAGHGGQRHLAAYTWALRQPEQLAGILSRENENSWKDWQELLKSAPASG